MVMISYLRGSPNIAIICMWTTWWLRCWWLHVVLMLINLILVISHIIILPHISSRSYRSINSSTSSLAKLKRDTGRSDEDINTIVTPTAPAAIHTGPITRARARQLNYQVLSFLGNDSNVHENMMLPKLDTFVLLTNEGPSLEKDDHWSKNKHGVDGMRKGDKNRVSSDDFRTLKPP